MNNTKYLSWLVYTKDTYGDAIMDYNVLEHYRFVEDLVRILQNTEIYKDFNRELKSLCMYYFWSKCEWETILTPFPTKIVDNNLTEYKKIDVYDQLRLNWESFVSYIWNNRNTLLYQQKQ